MANGKEARNGEERERATVPFPVEEENRREGRLGWKEGLARCCCCLSEPRLRGGVARFAANRRNQS